MHKTSRFGDVLLNTAKVVFETHGFIEPWASMRCPTNALSRPQWGTSLRDMGNQTHQALAYIDREYKDAKGRVELQRHVVAQLHRVEADAGEAETALDALLDDEASKLRILDYSRKWLGDDLEEMPANRA